MLPIIRIGTLTVSSYTVMFNVGIISMLVIMLIRRSYFKINALKAVLFTAFMTVSGILGTKVLYCIEYWEKVVANGFTDIGTPLFGAVLFVPLLMIPLCKFLGLRARQTVDACALCLPIMVGFLRFGCFFAGCCGGLTVTVCGVTFQWPTQMMDSIINFFILILICNLQQQSKYTARLYPIYMISYGLARFFIEFLRDTEKDWLGLGHGQWFALIAIVTGILWLAIARKCQPQEHARDNKGLLATYD